MESPAGDLIVCGTTRSFGLATSKILFAKLNPNGQACVQCNPVSGGTITSSASVGSGGFLQIPGAATSSGGNVSSGGSRLNICQ